MRTFSFLLCSTLVFGAIAQPGTLDPTWGGDGTVHADIALNSDLGLDILQQPDGKVLCVGYGMESGNGNIILARFNSDGTPDNSFDGNGQVQTDLGGDDRGRTVVLQADGKILVSGSTNAGAASVDFLLARYNANGSLDLSFGGGDGYVTLDFAGGVDQAYGSALQPDGKIVVSGAVGVGLGRIGVARFNSDGTLDTGFAGVGWAAPAVSVFSEGRRVAVQSDGKIVACGVAGTGSDWDLAAIRLNADGTVDATFNGTGSVVITMSPANDFVEDVAVQADGKVLLGGLSIVGAFADFTVVRLNTDGTLDNTFDTDGIVTTAIGATYDNGFAITALPNGKILQAGTASSATGTDMGLVCYNSDGSLDTGFGGGDGIATADLDNGPDYGTCMAIQADGKVLVGGYGLVGVDALAVARFGGVPIGIEELTTSFGSLRVFPNPAGENTILDLEMMRTEHVSCTLVDAKGRSVRTLFNAERSAGQHRETLDLSGIAAGQYMLVLRNEEGRTSVGVLKQ